jgi:hypothetical protein
MIPCRAITYIADKNHRPSWIGGVAAAKPQTGWLFKLLKNAHGSFSVKRTPKSIGEHYFCDGTTTPALRATPPIQEGRSYPSARYVLALQQTDQ